MIKKITTIKHVGNFTNFNWTDAVPPFEKTNIIFGYNGSGKTILSNIFNLFSSQREDGGERLFNDLKNNNQATVKIQFDAKEVQYKLDGGKHDIFVFNYDFVREHVYDGSATICREFDSSIVTEEQLKNPKIQSLETEIQTLGKHIERKRTEKNELDTKFTEIDQELRKEFNLNILDKRLPSIEMPSKAPKAKSEELRKRLDGVYGDYVLSQKQDELNTDSATLEVAICKELQINLDSVKNVLKKNISKEAGKKTKDKINLHAEFEPSNATSLNDWFEDGYHFLQHIHEKGEKSCPLCNSNIKEGIETIIKEYQQYFTDEYTQLMQEIEALLTTLNEDLNSITGNKQNMVQIRTLSSKYQRPVAFDEELSFDHKKLLDEISSKLKNKKDNTSLIEDISENHEVLKQAITSYNTKAAKVETAKANLLETLQEKALDPEQIITNAKSTVKDLVNAKFNSYKQGNQISDYHSLDEKILEDSNKLRGLKLERSRKIAALKDESKYVNDFLKHLGIHNFEIDIQKGEADENIHIIYLSGTTKTKLLYSLSEGEKTALAFAYFLSQIKYEIFVNPQKNIANTIIVIDDPISSLDENRLHTTACLIRDKFENAKQLFVLSHNLIFLKFFGNIISHKGRQDYYLQGNMSKVQLISLPEGLRNFQTSYFQKLSEIIEYNNGRISYRDAKKFIPNYLRVALETFLSFKLFVLKQGSARDRFRSAGLNKLTKTLKGQLQLGLYKDFPVVDDINKDTIINKLEKIRKMTDPQTHGSAQSLDEFNYIGELELKATAKDTLNIIQFLDKIHFDRISKNK